MHPLVSVIIPTYNRINMLPTALKSVFSQDYENLEIIVVDDCSTDGTREYLIALSRVKYACLFEHRGQCSTRNFGLDQAKGKYIQLLDDDDALAPGVIKRHVKYLEAHPEIDLIYGDMMLSNTFVMEHPEIKKRGDFKPDIRPGTPIDYDMKKALIKALKKPLDPKHSILYLYTPNYKPLRISTGTGLFRKNNIRYDPKIQEKWNCSADVDFWGQMILADLKFAYLPGLAFECRAHAQNLTTKNPPGTRIRWAVRRYIYDKFVKQLKDGRKHN